MAAVDASKAFDKIVHVHLFDKLLDRNVPLCFVKCIENWYSKLSAVVRWEGCLSQSFKLCSGVRQGGVLSPILFNIYVNELIECLESCESGCHIGRHFYGCVMYSQMI